ncbi:peptidylprolyl isomerase [Thermoproteota archaeon]
MKAKARHILTSTKKEAESIKQQIDSGADFADMAAQYSLCPSKAQGGALGEFAPGQMVKEFDDVVFSTEIGKVVGPVQTQFGYHLIEVTNRQ